MNQKMRTTLYVQHEVVDWIHGHLQHHNLYKYNMQVGRKHDNQIKIACVKSYGSVLSSKLELLL